MPYFALFTLTRFFFFHIVLSELDEENEVVEEVEVSVSSEEEKSNSAWELSAELSEFDSSSSEEEEEEQEFSDVSDRERKGKKKEKGKEKEKEREKEKDTDMSFDEALLAEQQQKSSSYAPAYLDHDLLNQFIPDQFTKQHRRKYFCGIPWHKLVKKLPSLEKWKKDEVQKKVDRLTAEEKKIWDAELDSDLKSLTLEHITQTAEDKATVIGQYFRFIRLIEGEKTKLKLEDIWDPFKMKAFLEFLKRYVFIIFFIFL